MLTYPEQDYDITTYLMPGFLPGILFAISSVKIIGEAMLNIKQSLFLCVSFT
jgi:hypothetical protein